MLCDMKTTNSTLQWTHIFLYLNENANIWYSRRFQFEISSIWRECISSQMIQKLSYFYSFFFSKSKFSSIYCVKFRNLKKNGQSIHWIKFEYYSNIGIFSSRKRLTYLLKFPSKNIHISMTYSMWLTQQNVCRCSFKNFYDSSILSVYCLSSTACQIHIAYRGKKQLSIV